MYSIPVRKLYIYTAPHIADPTHMCPITEEFPDKVTISYLSTWKLRLLLWLINKLCPPVSEETVQQHKDWIEKYGMGPMYRRK